MRDLLESISEHFVSFALLGFFFIAALSIVCDLIVKLFRASIRGDR